MSGSDLQTLPVTQLKGVGSALAEKLARIGLHTLQDLLFHLPLRYEDRTRLVPMSALRPGLPAVTQGQVLSSEVSFGRRRSLLVRLQDGSGWVTLRFFYFSAALKNQLQPGVQLQVYGEVRRGATSLEIIHPELTFLKANQPPPPLAQHLTPVYPVTEGLQQKRLRDLIDQVLNQIDSLPLSELLPLDGEVDLPGLPRPLLPLRDALLLVHRPPRDADLGLLGLGLHPAQRRLALEELLAQQLGMLWLRQKTQQASAWPLPVTRPALKAQLLAGLPFELTAAQQRVLNEIDADLQQPHPMLRLVQGDVGSGKTLVAALACLRAIAQGYQAALMAPTELLAEQHYQNLSAWMEPLGIGVSWLAGKQKGKAREQTLAAIASGESAMIVGTHALFQQSVRFQQLALVVIDEQHRFGVHQRLALRDKGIDDDRVPHQLIMTATPIPRTLAMSAYADLDLSVIDELPPGRQPITTRVMPDSRREEVIERLREACLSGRQAYWVCPLIEESEVLECQAAEVTATSLQQALPMLNIALVHGRMRPADKAQIMADFKQGRYHLLVATTVIEVGVDVPNATLMIIDNAERLGLAQLHQLRGRVGRGSEASFCVLLYHPPLSQQGQARLQVMRDTQDGFLIAQKDLEIRGPGEFLGTRQTGEINLRIADLVRDSDLLEALKPLALRLMQTSPDTAQSLVARWRGESLKFAQV